MIDEHYPDLTKREQQILRLIVEGLTNDEIGDRLIIAIDTVKRHRQNILDKFNVHRHSLGESGLSKSRYLRDELKLKATRMGYLPTLPYRLLKKHEALCTGSIQTYKADASSYGYGEDKEVFYRRLERLDNKKATLQEIQHFFHEVEVLTRVEHKNILSLLEFGWDEDDRPFYTMSYQANLKSISEVSIVSPQQLDKIFMQLLNVLDYLHWRGIHFNDLVPQNILLAKDKVFFANFGNSFLLEKSQSEKRTSQEREANLAPKQLPATPVLIQSDLRALGGIISQVLTQTDYLGGSEEPAPEKTEQVIDELRHTNFAKTATTKILEKLISSQPEGLYQSAREVTEDLLRLKGEQFRRDVSISKWFPGFNRIELFGRDDVLGLLQSDLRLLVDERQGGIRLIVGDMGIGKSVLMDQLMYEAWQHPAVIVSYAKAEQSHAADRGFMMWRDILSKLIEVALPTKEVAQATRDLQSLLHPKIKGASLGEDDIGSTSQATLRLFRTMRSEKKTNKGLKNKMVLLLLDDLQWMGEDSFKLLRTLNSLNLPVLIVGTCRMHDPTANATPKDISNKLKLSEKHIIKLENLNNESMLKICNRLLSAFDLTQILTPAHIDELIGAILEHCKGNPYLAKNFIETSVSVDGPETMRELVQILRFENEWSGYITRWLERLDSSTQFFLTTCAIVGRKFDLEVLRKIYQDQRQHRLEDLLLNCADKGILIEIGNRQWEFEHESVYNAALNLLPDKGESLYETVARAFEDTYGEYIAYAGQLGDLWEKAGFREKAVTYYLQAARFEISKSAYYAAKKHAENILRSKLIDELPSLNQAELKLIQYFAYMGLGRVDLALDSARNALDLLGYKTIINSHFRLALIKASLRQIWHRLHTAKSKKKKTMEELYKFRIAVRCHRALAQLEYFNNNFWRVFYYMMAGLNLCDEIGDDGQGQKADLYAAATVVAGPLGPGLLSKLIASQYEELAENDLNKSGDKALELWTRLVFGMYYGSIGRWNDARRHLERGLQLGAEGIDQRRRYEVLGILYFCYWYSGEWEDSRSTNKYLQELVREDKVDLDSLSQTDLWPPLFDGDRLLYMGEFEQGEIPLRQVCSALENVDQAAWLRGLGVLAQIYFRRGELTEAENTANQFFDSVCKGPVMPFYATEGFFGALEVYLELLKDNVKSKELKKKINKLLYYLLDQPILAFSKRYPIAKPRSLLYKAKYVLITTSKKHEAVKLVDRALKYAQELNMPYDKGLILQFIGTHFCDDNSACDRLKEAHTIFEELGATWNFKQVDELLKNMIIVLTLAFISF